MYIVMYDMHDSMTGYPAMELALLQESCRAFESTDLQGNVENSQPLESPFDDTLATLFLFAIDIIN